MLKDYLLIIAAIAIIGAGYLFFENKLSQPEKRAITPTPQATATQNFTTSDGRITISFPSTWYVTDTTQPGTYGKFGQYVQTFTISSYKDATATVIPQNAVKVDFAIEQGGANLPIESLLDCGGKTLTCQTVGIDNEQFIKSTATLNTGMQTIGIGTFYDQNILIGNAQIQTGTSQAAHAKETEKILNSIKFNTPTQ